MTIIILIVDFVMFCIVAANFGNSGSEPKSFALLLCLIGYIVCDLVFFSFFEEIRYAFHPDVIDPLRKSMIGYFADMKTFVADGFSNTVNKIRRKKVNVVPLNKADNVGSNYVANVASNVIRNAINRGVKS